MTLPFPRTLVLAGVILVAVVIYFLISRKYQRCPHCGTPTPRALRGWRRCRRCGRQYHRSVKRMGQR